MRIFLRLDRNQTKHERRYRDQLRGVDVIERTLIQDVPVNVCKTVTVEVPKEITKIEYLDKIVLKESEKYKALFYSLLTAYFISLGIFIISVWK